MGNVQVLTAAEVAVRNERRRQDEQHGGAATDDTRTQEAWRAQVRKQVNRMVEMDTALLASRSPQTVDVLEDYVATWTKVAALAHAAIESLDRTNVVRIGPAVETDPAKLGSGSDGSAS